MSIILAGYVCIGIMLILLQRVTASVVVPTVAALHIPGAGKKSKAGLDVYDEEFFSQHRKHDNSYRILVQAIEPFLEDPSFSIVDVGCGHGLLVEAWRARGRNQSFCVEGAPGAKAMWPTEQAEEYYIQQDLTKPEAKKRIPKTNYVTSFEVAEHLDACHADHFVSLLITHRPSLVFFGAATDFQDRGQNPTHVNENSFHYWAKKFEEHGYSFDGPTSLQIRHSILRDPGYRGQAWWYPKNLLVFANNDVISMEDLLQLKSNSSPTASMPR